MDWLWFGASLVGSALFGYGIWESFRLRLTVYNLMSGKLPSARNDLRIAHLSDLHTKCFGLKERRAVQLVAECQPHLIALTGDLTAWRNALPAAETLLQALCAIAPVFAVEGNAEVCNELTELLAATLHRLGGRWLRNEAVPFGDGVWVAGTDDPHRYRADAKRALQDVPEDAFCLLLSHSPDIIVQPAANRADLILCGHTHGGQVRLPFIGTLYKRARYIPRQLAWGRHTLRNGAMLITTSGVGTTRLPVRFLCPPEVVCVVVRSNHL